ncbi:hypothetical protein SACC_22270 [Saccharolobus caldissimus]|uniref:Uncharacterized protein n=1 Tax=Saccharolobus caldissimus TaxID=1702097 RepID=A0AAQ4CTS9_9CREN|nr:hypothetical protein SACC_22270 [Saccharolobus caldissimus]
MNKLKLRYVIFLLPFILWWIPLLGPFFTGLLFSYYFKTNYKYSITISILYSILLSFLTSYILLNLVKINLFNNIFHGLVIILNIIGSTVCVITAYVSSYHGTFAKILDNSVELEFTVNNIEEIDGILSQYLDINTCSKPNIRFITENRIEVTRICNNFKISYEVLRSGKILRVKARFRND